MARPSSKPEINIPKIPLKPDEALRLLLRVKPTDAMPRPGAHPTEAKPKRKRAKKISG